MKKVVSILLCAVLLLSVFTIVPVSVSAAEMESEEVGVNSDFAQPGNSKNSAGDCVAYARARFQEVFGFALHNTGGDNARGYYTNAGYWGDQVSSTPRAGALAVWDYDTGGFGSHVAFVEKVVGNTVYLTEGGWSGTGYHEDSPQLSNMNRSWAGHFQQFLGFVYVKGASTAHTCNHDVYKYFWASHPHYNVYACSICGKEWTDYNSSRYYDQCGDCRHTISYNANGGQNAPAAQTKYFMSTLTLSTSVPTRSGYEFLGWSTSADSTSIAYQPGSSYTADRNQTLYAVWKQLGYTITLDLQGGTMVNSGNLLLPFGGSVQLPSEIPTKKYHRFYGWTYAINGADWWWEPGQTLYENGSEYPPENMGQYADSNKNIKLYATWIAPIEIQLNQQKTVLCDEGERYFVFSPSESGYYLVSYSSDKGASLSLEGDYYSFGQKQEVRYFEKGKNYHFTARMYYNNTEFSITIQESPISNWSIAATHSAEMNDYTAENENFYLSSFGAVVTLYDSSGSVSFQGSPTEALDRYGFRLSCYVRLAPGTHSIPVYLGNTYKNMNVTVVQSSVVSMTVHVIKQTEIVLGEHDASDRVNDSLKNLSVDLMMQNGSVVTVDLGTLASSNYTFHGNKFTPSLQNETLSLGKNRVNLSYRGITSTYEINVVESPVSRMTILSAPTVYDNEYYHTGLPGENINEQLLVDHPITLKVFYKDQTSKLLTIRGLRVQDATQLGDTEHFINVTQHLQQWGNPDAENYFTVDYLDRSVDVYVNILPTETGFDKLVDFELATQSTIPFDKDLLIRPSLEGTKIKLVFESGATQIVTAEGIGGTVAAGQFRIGTNIYSCGVWLDSNSNAWYVRIDGISKTLWNISPLSVTSIEVLGDVEDNAYLTNAPLKITYSDNSVYYVKTYPKHLWYRGTPTDHGALISTYSNGDYNFTEYKQFDGKIVNMPSDKVKAKNLAFHVAKNCNISNGYRVTYRSQEDIDQLLRFASFFTDTFSLMKTKFFTTEIINSAAYKISVSEYYPYLSKYYGISMADIRNSEYYDTESGMLLFDDERYYIANFDNEISLYKETADAYTFQYVDENKTQYIEISKDLVLRSVSDTAPAVDPSYQITMTDGYSTAETAFAGQTVTVCTNVPAGKRFVGWTSSDGSVTFANAKSVETTFIMPEGDVTVTPLFRDDAPLPVGDANNDGRINVRDVTTIQRYVAELQSLDEWQLAAADTDGNGVVDINDATRLQIYLAEYDVQLG